MNDEEWARELQEARELLYSHIGLNPNASESSIMGEVRLWVSDEQWRLEEAEETTSQMLEVAKMAHPELFRR
ncbi:MAG: hypothetical protein GY915_05830 [bacterium]|nr:hypothetical protein [bacterium]